MIFLKILGTKTKFSQPLTNCGTHIVGQKWNTIFFFFWKIPVNILTTFLPLVAK